jgi:putrescine transport system substrate-binding protein
VPASLSAVDAAVREDRNVYPDEAMLAASFVASTPPRDVERARSRLWSRFKAGR